MDQGDLSIMVNGYRINLEASNLDVLQCFTLKVISFVVLAINNQYMHVKSLHVVE